MYQKMNRLKTKSQAVTVSNKSSVSVYEQITHKIISHALGGTDYDIAKCLMWLSFVDADDIQADYTPNTIPPYNVLYNVNDKKFYKQEKNTKKWEVLSNQKPGNNLKSVAFDNLLTQFDNHTKEYPSNNPFYVMGADGSYQPTHLTDDRIDRVHSISDIFLKLKSISYRNTIWDFVIEYLSVDDLPK